MFNRKYKKGMADAAKAYEAFGKKQEDALNFILEEVRQGNKNMEEAIQELNGNIDNLYAHLKSKEKAQLYTIYTPFDIKNLGSQEKLFLVGALYRLTRDRTPNENQQNYLRAIQKYLEIKEPPFGVDPLAIENIEDIPTQKAIFQAVLEFLRLQDGDSYDETELQQEFLDSFSINSKSRQAILDHVELLYMATGAQGLAEKYGYVAEVCMETDYMPEEDCNSGDKILSPKECPVEVLDFVADLHFSAMPGNSVLETANYFTIFEDWAWTGKYGGKLEPGVYSVNKANGELALICTKAANTELFDIKEIRICDYTNDLIDVVGYEKYWRIDLAQKDVICLYEHGNKEDIVASNKDYLVIDDRRIYPGEICLYKLSTKKRRRLFDHTRCTTSRFVCDKDALYAEFDQRCPDIFEIRRYDFDSKKIDTIVEIPTQTCWMTVCNGQLFWSEDSHLKYPKRRYHYMPLIGESDYKCIGAVDAKLTHDYYQDGCIIEGQDYTDLYYLSFETKELIELDILDIPFDIKLGKYLYFKRGSNIARVSLDNLSEVEYI